MIGRFWFNPNNAKMDVAASLYTASITATVLKILTSGVSDWILCTNSKEMDGL